MVQPITAADAARLMREQDAVLVDIREPAELAGARVPGAVSLPLSRLEAPGPAVPAGRPVLFICASGMRTDRNAERLAARVAPAAAFVVSGGLRAWQAAGLPLENGGATGGRRLGWLTWVALAALLVLLWLWLGR